jgi:ANTAR domain/GAF domain
MARDDVTAAIAAAATALNEPVPSLESTLATIAFAARDSMPGFDLAGISTVDRKGNVETRAVTDPRVLEFDKLQYSLAEGPCLDALGAAHVVSVPRLRHEQRWPNYVPRVLGLGLRSQLAVKISIDDAGTLGGINLYSTISDDIDPEAESIAELFAVHAAIAMGSVIKIGQLSSAMQTRKVIGQAIGILMERYGIHEDDAFHFLVRASQNENIKLRDIAAGIVDEANRRPGAQS